MRAVIEISNTIATLEDWRWSCDDPILEHLLNSQLPIGGPSPSDPAPSLHAAQHIAARFGGEVVSYELPKYVEGTIY